MNDLRGELRRLGLPDEARLAVAYSGGLDSTVLLHLAADALGAERVLALHVDHGVREASRADEAHCRGVAEALRVEYRAARLAPGRERGPGGFEAALRDARYETLAALCREAGVAHVAAAHHADDALETHLLALVRGSGLTGLAGPRARRALGQGVTLLRPLLDTPRSALAAYAAERGLSWREDESNLDRRRTRARLRHEVLPVLRELAAGHGGDEAAARALAHLRGDRDTLEALVAERARALGVEVSARGISVPKGVSADDPALVHSLRGFLRELGGGGHPPSTGAVRRVLAALAERGRSRLIDVAGARLRVEGGRIAPPQALTVPLPRPLRRDEWVSQPGLAAAVRLEIREEPVATDVGGRTEVFDYDALGAPPPGDFVLRGACEGDRFEPFGLDGSVRLLRWLANRGVARSLRPYVPLVALRDEVVWVPGHRRSAAAPVTDETTRYLVLVVRASR